MRSENNSKFHCKICEIAECHNFAYKKLEKILKPKKENEKKEGNVLCDFCYSVIGRGLQHHCSIKTRRENLQTILPDKVQQQIANKVNK